MPWSNQNGGGGGPWGGGGGNNQGPRGGGNPPDLEELIRRGQDKLQSLFGGSGSGGSPATGNTKLIAVIIGVALVAVWLTQAIYTVQPDERGVELVFGQPKDDISQPGLHLILWPFETVEVATIVEREMTSGGNSRNGTTDGLMLTGDQNIVDVEFKILYSVQDPKAFLFNLARPEDTLRQVAESAMREVVGRRPAQDIFRDNREVIASEVQTIIQTVMDSFPSGIVVNQVAIEDAAPPREVADAFDEVQRAEQDEDRFVEEANQYANQKLGQARGQGAQVKEEASGYKDRVVNEATGEAQRFLSVYQEYAKAPDVTRTRIYLETMEKVLKGSDKVIIGQEGGNGVVPYLPLPEVQKNAGGQK